PCRRAGVIWVVFDYGGVLSYLPTQRDLTMLAAAAGAGLPEVAGAYRRWRRGYDLADLDAAGYWRQVGASLGRHYDDDTITGLTGLDRVAWLRVRAGTVDLIEDLADAGWPLALLSNAPADL